MRAGAVEEQPPTGAMPNHSQAGQVRGGQVRSLSVYSPPTLQVPPIGQTLLKAREPVMQSMGLQSLDRAKEEWTVSLGAKGMNSTVPKQQGDGTEMASWEGLGNCLKYQRL